MKVTITARNFELTDAIKEHTENKAKFLEKHGHSVLEAHFILALEKGIQIAEVNVHVAGDTLHSKVESNDLYQSINEVITKVVHQLDKHKNK